MVYSPVKSFSLWRFTFIIWVNNDLFAPEVDNLIKIESCHVHLTRKEDGAISYVGQLEQSSKIPVKLRVVLNVMSVEMDYLSCQQRNSQPHTRHFHPPCQPGLPWMGWYNIQSGLEQCL